MTNALTMKLLTDNFLGFPCVASVCRQSATSVEQVKRKGADDYLSNQYAGCVFDLGAGSATVSGWGHSLSERSLTVPLEVSCEPNEVHESRTFRLAVDSIKSHPAFGGSFEDGGVRHHAFAARGRSLTFVEEPTGLEFYSFEGFGVERVYRDGKVTSDAMIADLVLWLEHGSPA